REEQWYLTVSVSGLRLGKVCDSYPICLALHESIFPVPSFTRKGDVAGFYGFIDLRAVFPSGRPRKSSQAGGLRLVPPVAHCVLPIQSTDRRPRPGPDWIIPKYLLAL
ncbi:MAG: hypothetical protein O6837_10325, partial [Deltaproteobacteria bacterium]|nr:hypothetical protein [Deltaproteobacteria bacterium]MCZ6563031.1 hypothetical protein [Deltaproteobacteria bacterium]